MEIIKIFPDTVAGKISTLTICVVLSFVFGSLLRSNVSTDNMYPILLSGNIEFYSNRTNNQGRYATPSYLYIKNTDSENNNRQVIAVSCHGMPDDYCLPFKITKLNNVMIKILVTKESDTGLNGIVAEIRELETNKVILENNRIEFYKNKINTGNWYNSIAFWIFSVYSVLLLLNLISKESSRRYEP